jgi:hypothetical protein
MPVRVVGDADREALDNPSGGGPDGRRRRIPAVRVVAKARNFPLFRRLIQPNWRISDATGCTFGRSTSRSRPRRGHKIQVQSVADTHRAVAIDASLLCPRRPDSAKAAQNWVVSQFAKLNFFMGRRSEDGR